MPKKKKEVYVQGTAFTRSELNYIENGHLSMPYELDVSLATILIPPDHAELYRDNLHVLHLINNFGFTAQITIDAKLKPVTAFNPKLRSMTKTVENVKVIDLVLPKRGETWIHPESRGRYYFDKVDKDSFRVKFLGSLMNDKTFKHSDIEYLVANGHLVKEVR